MHSVTIQYNASVSLNSSLYRYSICRGTCHLHKCIRHCHLNAINLSNLHLEELLWWPNMQYFCSTSGNYCAKKTFCAFRSEGWVVLFLWVIKHWCRPLWRHKDLSERYSGPHTSVLQWKVKRLLYNTPLCSWALLCRRLSSSAQPRDLLMYL